MEVIGVIMISGAIMIYGIVQYHLNLVLLGLYWRNTLFVQVIQLLLKARIAETQ